MFWQRDAATLQPNAEEGRGPKGVFHLTPLALSKLSAETAEPVRERSTDERMAMTRATCRMPATKAARWRTVKHRCTIIDEEGAIGGMDLISSVGTADSIGVVSNSGVSGGMAEITRKMNVVTEMVSMTSRRRNLAKMPMRDRMTVGPLLESANGVASRAGDTRLAGPALAAIGGVLVSMVAVANLVVLCRVRDGSGGRGSTLVLLLRRRPRSPAAAELLTQRGGLRCMGLAAISGECGGQHVLGVTRDPAAALTLLDALVTMSRHGDGLPIGSSCLGRVS
jgi:hypothetical protein